MKNIKKLFLVTAAALVIGAVFPYADYAMDKTYGQLKVLVDVMELIRENYVEPIDTQKLVYGAARGMVDQLDDFSQFMDPDLYQRVKSDTEGEFGGVGITVEPVDGWLTVVTPMPGTPAFIAGIMPGDKIIKIEGVSTKDMLIDEAIKKLRGKPGTKVKITIAREPAKKGDDWTTQDIELTREVIKAENVKWRMLDDKIGYIKIVEFAGHVTESFRKAIDDLHSQGMQALVLDLRYNPGGLLTSAVDISKLFLNDDKMIVYTKGRKPENYQEFRADGKAPYETLPLVVLINRYSASASEILSGAMQDDKRAVIIGERSFGKASVQQIIPLSDGSALRLTIAKYYTPSGKSIQRDESGEHGGIIPDITVKVPPDVEKKLLQQDEALYYPPAKKERKGETPPVKTNEKFGALVPPPARPEKTPDEVLDRAVELLKARDILANLKPGK